MLAESEEQTLLRDVLKQKNAEDGVVLAVGPEGGWTEGELQSFQKSGWISASLGNTILRAETAAMAATAVVASALYLVKFLPVFSRLVSRALLIVVVFWAAMAVSKLQSHPAPFVPDDRQREAIAHVHGPMLVVAGAGTGKTSVLIHRIARLVEQGQAKPEEVLALTYTVAAAGEMRDRVRGLLGKPIHSATFHDYCLDLLKRNGKDFGVLDEKDLWIYLRKRIHELHLEHYIRAANVGQFLNDLLGFLSRCHDELVTPEKYAEYVARLERGETQFPGLRSRKIS